MILRFICDLLFGVVHLIVALIPQIPNMQGINVSMQPVMYAVNLANLFFDVPMLSTCLLLMLVTANAKFVFAVLRWLIAKIPGVS